MVRIILTLQLSMNIPQGPAFRDRYMLGIFILRDKKYSGMNEQ